MKTQQQFKSKEGRITKNATNLDAITVLKICSNARVDETYNEDKPACVICTVKY